MLDLQAAMKVTTFESTYSVEPELIDIDWVDFLESLEPHDTSFSSREEAPLFSPAEWPPNRLRSKNNVVRIHFGVLDLDDIQEDAFLALQNRLSFELGLVHAFYSTWKHGISPGLVRARLLVPFSRPVEAREWTDFWPKMVTYLTPDAPPDQQAKDASRIYWIPSCPPERLPTAFFLSCPDGKPLDVDQLVASNIISSSPSRTRSVLTSAAFQAWVKTWRPRTAHAVWLHHRFKALIAGEPLADEGERDETVFKMASALVDQFPDATSESLAALFEPSLSSMAKDNDHDAITLDLVEQKISRLQSNVDAEEAAQDKISREIEEQRIRLAFGTSRSTPYTSDELAGFRVGKMDFQRQWVIQQNMSYYVFCNGEYQGPFTPYEIQEAAAIYLAPAVSADVSVYTMTKQGDVRIKTPQELVHEYGQIAKTVVLDMTAQSSRFDSLTRTMVEAPCPRRQVLEPTYFPEVDEWLRKMAGPAADKLLDWVASVTSIAEPCSALYLEGPKDAGKSLLANGLSRIWTVGGPTELVDAMGSFNSMVIQCPLIFGDEFVPTDIRGRGRSGELRAFIQARSRTLRRKFLTDATLQGCIRLILAANNLDLLTTNENLTNNDIEAIVDRVLHVHVQPEAIGFLKQNRLLLDDIASHALWLADNRQVDRSHRFIVTGGRTELHRNLTTSSGLRSAVCNWLVSYLLEPQKVDINRTLLVRRYCGTLCVTSRGLAKHWGIYETNLEPPPTGAISKALAGLSFPKKAQLAAGDGRRTSYWIVDPENLFAWAEDNGFADREVLSGILSAEGAQGDETREGSIVSWRNNHDL